MSIIISFIALILSILSFMFCFKIFSIIKKISKMQEELITTTDKIDNYVMPEDTGNDNELLELKDVEGNSKKLIKNEES